MAVGNTAVVSCSPHTSRRKSVHFLPFNLPATFASRNFTEQAGVEIADFIAVPSCVAPAAAGEGPGTALGEGAGVAVEPAGLSACAITTGDAGPASAGNPDSSISAARAAIPNVLMPAPSSPRSRRPGPIRPVPALSRSSRAFQPLVAFRIIAAALLNPFQAAIAACGLVGVVLVDAGVHACLAGGLLGVFRIDRGREDCVTGRDRRGRRRGLLFRRRGRRRSWR